MPTHLDDAKDIEPASLVSRDYCRVMARYNHWMNERLYATCAQLSSDDRNRDRRAFFGSITGTLNHLLWADRMWLGRFTDRPCGVPAFGADMFAEFDELRSERDVTDQAMLEWSENVSTDALASTLVYTSKVDGKTRRIAASLAAVHMFNHGIHHRGQLTTLLSQAGIDPGVTDLPWLPGIVTVVG
jgi:uncharacterized damage-inducible protein DinB